MNTSIKNRCVSVCGRGSGCGVRERETCGVWDGRAHLTKPNEHNETPSIDSQEAARSQYVGDGLQQERFGVFAPKDI